MMIFSREAVLRAINLPHNALPSRAIKKDSTRLGYQSSGDLPSKGLLAFPAQLHETIETPGCGAHHVKQIIHCSNSFQCHCARKKIAAWWIYVWTWMGREVRPTRDFVTQKALQRAAWAAVIQFSSSLRPSSNVKTKKKSATQPHRLLQNQICDFFSLLFFSVVEWKISI